MKKHQRESNGLKVKVWDDSGVSWAVQDRDRTEHYPKNKFTMKDAVDLHCRLFASITA